LIQDGIDRLVVIGGDGSLTGAHIFHQEWLSLVDERANSGAITSKNHRGAALFPHRRIGLFDRQ